MRFLESANGEVILRPTTRLAVNYSKPAASLFAAQTIDFDLFKCPDWPDMIAEAGAICPAYAHFPLFTGRVSADDAVWSRLADLRDQTGTPFVNIHLAPHIDNFPGMAMESTTQADINRVVELCVRDVEALGQRFGIESVIVENAPHDARPQYAIPNAALLPETMTRVIEVTGAGLLLDTAHVRISALMLDIPLREFMDGLPTSALRELHVTGVAWDDEHGRWNDHYAMSEADWELVDAVYAHIHSSDWPTPEIVALEYGGVGGVFETRSDPAVLTQDVPRLLELVRRPVAASRAE